MSAVYVVCWTHPTIDTERCRGDRWPDRESADYIADVMRRSGCRDVKVVREQAAEEQR